MADFASIYKRLHRRALVEMDLTDWRWQTRQLRRFTPMPASKKVLFCDLISSIATAKTEAVFASALERRGVDTAVLLKQPSSILERIFSSTSTPKIFYLKEKNNSNSH